MNNLVLQLFIKKVDTIIIQDCNDTHILSDFQITQQNKFWHLSPQKEKYEFRS